MGDGAGGSDGRGDGEGGGDSSGEGSGDGSGEGSNDGLGDWNAGDGLAALPTGLTPPQPEASSPAATMNASALLIAPCNGPARRSVISPA